jgi:hypothetical protein
MLRLLAPIFPHSRQAFEAQFTAAEGGNVFRENQIGPAHALTDDRQQQLLAVHDCYLAIKRWSFWGFLILVLIVLPLVRMLNNPGFPIGPNSAFSRSLFLLPVVYVTATALWARWQLRARLADAPVAAPALSKEEAKRVLLRNLSPISLVIVPMTMLAVFMVYGPEADYLAGVNALWTFAAIGAFAISTWLGWQKFCVLSIQLPESAA